MNGMDGRMDDEWMDEWMDGRMLNEWNDMHECLLDELVIE